MNICVKFYKAYTQCIQEAFLATQRSHTCEEKKVPLHTTQQRIGLGGDPKQINWQNEGCGSIITGGEEIGRDTNRFWESLSPSVVLFRG